MKRILLVLALMPAMISCTTDADPEPPEVPAKYINKENPPVIKLAEKVHDFGAVPTNSVNEFDMEIENVGESDLVIVDVRAQCGCTVPEWPREPIAPGETGKIHVKFTSNYHLGSFKKWVKIYANTYPSAETEFFIIGEIED